MSIEEGDFSIWHNLEERKASNLQADLTDIVFKVQLLFAIQKESTETTCNENYNAKSKQFGSWSWNDKTINVVEIILNTTPARPSSHRLKSLPVLAINALTLSLTRIYTPPSSSTLLGLATSACEVCYDPAHFLLGNPL